MPERNVAREIKTETLKELLNKHHRQGGWEYAITQLLREILRDMDGVYMEAFDVVIQSKQEKK